ncbi:MAG: phage baseplate assembly protein V [Candidatus Azobacteroides sp.]|nr:phage baseplate assembly protein V [Candidatus Azobacteroides sp.]
MAELNAAEATVVIAGTQVLFKRLQLAQKFNAHHTCEIVVDYDAFGKEKWMENPTKYIRFIGEDINITFRMKTSSETVLFSGIVTNAEFTGRHGSENSIVITGAGKTILLDGKPAMDSFTDLPLQNIVEEAVSNSGNGGSVIAKPKFSSKLDYVCQYGLSCWEFLNYLSWNYGEPLLYDGQNCYFGMKTGETVTLEYDKEMTYFDLSANLVPQKFNRRHYLKHDDNNINKDDPSDVPGVRGYLAVSKQQAEKIFTSEVTTPLMADVNSKQDLDDLVEAEKSRAVGEMLIMRGRTQTCKVKIGCSVSIQMPAKMKILQSVDTFLVTEITHYIDEEGHYSNSFSGIIDGIENIPMAEPKMPIAMPQIAIVKENVEPRGRGLVKVQTDWQKLKNKTTNWIRVQSLDAGKSDIVPFNRGHVFIPEIDDIVMLGFEYGDPSRPYVAGSIFSEFVSKGGYADNNIKSIKTRSGHTIEYNDNQSGDWGITIKDKNDDIIHFDTNGKSIRISAPEKISIVSKDIEIIAQNQLVLHSEKDTQQTIGTEFNQSVGGDATLVFGKNLKASVDAAVEMKVAKDAEVSIHGELTEMVDKDVKISSSDKMEIQSQSDMTLKSGSNVYISE